MAKQIKRTKKGRFAKGTGGGPGKRAKKDSPVPSSQAIRDAFYKAFVEIFAKSGDPKALVEFCKKNQTNMKLLITEIRKLLPELAEAQDDKSVFVIERIITDDPNRLPEVEQIKMKADAEMGEKKGDERIFRMQRPGDKPPGRPGPPDPEAMTDEQLRKGIDELEKKKADILTALAEKRPDKSKAVN